MVPCKWDRRMNLFHQTNWSFKIILFQVHGALLNSDHEIPYCASYLWFMEGKNNKTMDENYFYPSKESVELYKQNVDKIVQRMNMPQEDLTFSRQTDDYSRPLPGRLPPAAPNMPTEPFYKRSAEVQKPRSPPPGQRAYMPNAGKGTCYLCYFWFLKFKKYNVMGRGSGWRKRITQFTWK